MSQKEFQKFAALTTGNTVSVQYISRAYPITVVECQVRWLLWLLCVAAVCDCILVL